MNSRPAATLHAMCILSCICLCLSALSACDSQPKLKPLGKDAVIVAFGDSLTVGMGANPGQSYPAVLAKMSGRTVINAGISGETSDAGLQRLPAVIAEHKPQLVIICHGANDILRRQSMADTENNIRSMVKIAKDSNIDVVLVAVPAFNLWASPPEFYARIAQDTNLPLEPEIIGNLEKNRKMKSDQVHFNADGYQLMAEAIYKILQDANAL